MNHNVNIKELNRIYKELKKKILQTDYLSNRKKTDISKKTTPKDV